MAPHSRFERAAAKILHWANLLRRDIGVVYLAARDPRVPRHAKLVAAAVAAYALSPIDLIPDFVPVIGHLDDVVIVPLGLWLALRLIPPEVLTALRQQAVETQLPKSRVTAAVVIGLWLAGLLGMALLAIRLMHG